MAGDTLSRFGLGLSFSVTPLPSPPPPPPVQPLSSSANRDDNTKSTIWWLPPAGRRWCAWHVPLPPRRWETPRVARSGPAMSPQPVDTRVRRGPSPCWSCSVFIASRTTATWPFFIFRPSVSCRSALKRAGRLSKPTSSSASTIPLADLGSLCKTRKTRNPFFFFFLQATRFRTQDLDFSISLDICCRALWVLQCNWLLLSHGVRFQPSVIPAPPPPPPRYPSYSSPSPAPLPCIPPVTRSSSRCPPCFRTPPPPPPPPHCWIFSLQFKLTLSSFPSSATTTPFSRKMVQKNTFNYDTGTQYAIFLGKSPLSSHKTTLNR